MSKPFRRQFKYENKALYVDRMAEAKNFTQVAMVKELVNSKDENEQEAAFDYLRAAGYYSEDLVTLAGKISRESKDTGLRESAQDYFDSQRIR